MRAFAFLFAVFVLLTIALGYVTGVPHETGARLVTGWLAFLGRTLSRATINWSGVATIALCAALLLFGGHRFAVWLSSASAPADDASRPPRRWPLRRTALLLAIVVLMFVAGISFIGLVHQTAWLATSPEPMSEQKLRLRRNVDASEDNLHEGIGTGFKNWLEVYQRPPTNGRDPGTFASGSHSWQTRILPFFNGYGYQNIDLKLDWDDPTNAPAFRRFVPEYLSPEFGVLRESRGFAVSHYAGNVRFFGPQPPTLEALKKDGHSMIVCGEVAHDFVAWGDPANLRDPTLGVNRSPAGFGSADKTGAQFLMADGSTRFLSTNIDPRVLGALAAPAVENPSPDTLQSQTGSTEDQGWGNPSEVQRVDGGGVDDAVPLLHRGSR